MLRFRVWGLGLRFRASGEYFGAFVIYKGLEEM